MKKLFLIPLLIMAFAFSVDIGDTHKADIALTEQTSLEIKESYKLEDGEYINAVATKSSFASEPHAGVGLFTLFVALSGFFARNRERLSQIGGAALLIMFAFVNVEAAASLAVFPLVVKQFKKEGDDAGTITKEMLQKMSEKNGEAISKAVTDAFKNAVTPEQLTTKLEELGLKKDSIKELTDAIKTQGEWMRMQETKAQGSNKDWRQNISKAFQKEGLATELDKVRKNKSGVINIVGGEDEFQNKVVGNITTSSVTTDSGGNAILDLINVDDLIGMNLRDPWIDQYATVTRTAKPVYSYADAKPKDGDAAFVAEANPKSQVDLNYVVKTLTPKKVAAYEIMSDEAITDIPRLDSEARNLILKRVLLKRQNKILFGAGAGADPTGVSTLAPAWDGASWTGDKVLDPNLYDVIVAMANQIYNAHNYTDESHYYPNLAVMNPADLAALKLKKNELGMYLFPQFQLASGNGQSITVDGITILPKRDISTGKIMMGDFTKLRIINYIDYNIQMGWINDQFINNLFTMLGETRFYTLIRDLDKKAFVYDDISDVVASIKQV